MEIALVVGIVSLCSLALLLSGRVLLCLIGAHRQRPSSFTCARCGALTAHAPRRKHTP